MFTRETMLSEVLNTAPQTAPLFYSIGMHCLGCALSSSENLEQACAAHGVDVDAFLEALNQMAESAE